jgi:hypothetical protein
MLEHERSPFTEARRQAFTKVIESAVQLGVGAPTQGFGVDEHLLRAHLQDDHGVRADKHSGVRDVLQEAIELRPVSPLFDWIGPHQHPIQREQLLSCSVNRVVGIHDGLRIDTETLERCEHVSQLACPGERSRRIRRIPLCAPQESHPHGEDLLIRRAPRLTPKGAAGSIGRPRPSQRRCFS